MQVAILHNAVAADATPDDRDVLVQVDAVAQSLGRLGHSYTVLPVTLDLADLKRRLGRPDAAFNLVESLDQSDRLMPLVPALLESLGIRCTGSSALTLAMTNDKLFAKEQLRLAGLPTPAWDGGLGSVPTAPFIVKTVGEHASFGIDDQAVVWPADLRGRTIGDVLAERTANLGRRCFAERFIEGREFNLSLLAKPGGVDVLPPAEIDFSRFPAGKPRIVGYDAKWSEQSFEYTGTPRRFDFPTGDAPLLDRLRRIAASCWEPFRLRGYARVDFRVDEAGEPWVLEINTNPCLSPDAGFAAALSQAGIAYETAVERILASSG